MIMRLLEKHITFALDQKSAPYEVVSMPSNDNGNHHSLVLVHAVEEFADMPTAISNVVIYRPFHFTAFSLCYALVN